LIWNPNIDCYSFQVTRRTPIPTRFEFDQYFFRPLKVS
jgi:hypothetical protein